MVQSATWMSASKPVTNSWEDSKKSSSFTSSSSQKKEQQKQKDDNSKKNDNYGAWGSTFKNKNHFANMHHC